MKKPKDLALPHVSKSKSGALREGKNLTRACGPFSQFAKKTSFLAGHPGSFLVALAMIVVWLVTGPFFHYSDTWQLIINTSTTIITFLMVFLIQNSQNRDSQAVQLKLDELIRSQEGAHTALLDLEELTDQDLSRIKTLYLEIAKQGREQLKRGEKDTGIPDIAP